MIVDIYTHIFPERFFQELERGSPKLGNMGKRLRGVPKLFDLDLRFRDMDEIGDYRQIISLPNPPIEDIAEGAVASNLAKVANDSMAELVAKHPDRFPAFAAAVNMHDVDFSIAEAERAIKMGARGVQTFTNIAGHPLDEPRFRPFFAAMAKHDLPVVLFEVLADRVHVLEAQIEVEQLAHRAQPLAHISQLGRAALKLLEKAFRENVGVDVDDHGASGKIAV